MKSKLVSRKSALRILEWCKSTYGDSQFNKLSTLKLRVCNGLVDDESPFNPITATYSPIDNEITINLSRIRTLIGLCGVVIHEYTHFQQDIKVMYHKYTEKYGRNYENHPYEVTANTRENRDKVACKQAVIKQLRNSR